MRIVRRVRADVGVLLLATVGAAACVDAYDGSNVQVDLARGVQLNPRGTEVPEPDQPPVNTHYELFAADAVYKLNADGTPVLDGSGQPVIDRTYLFSVKQFQIRPVIDVASPCLIELEDTLYPGLHVTQVGAKVREATGIADPFNANCAATDKACNDKVTDVLNADRRVNNLALYQGALKAVTTFANFRYPAIGTACVGMPGADPLLIPPATCIDAPSNAQRLSLCRALWKANPDWYEGSDKVFTLPLSGEFFGMVDGSNPANGGFVGGASFFVDQNLIDLDAYLMNWQYDDLDHDGQPDYPASVPAEERSATGYTYMQGTPRSVARGVITVPMAHPTNPRITARVVIFPNLGHDDVHF